MRTLREAISPMAVAGLVLWLVVMVVTTNLAIPVFANVSGGPQTLCPQPTCPSVQTMTTVEWLPSLITAFLAATAVVAVCWGAVTMIRRRG